MRVIDHRPEVAAAIDAAYAHRDEVIAEQKAEWAVAMDDLAGFFIGLGTLLASVMLFVLFVGFVKLVWCLV